MRLTLTPVLASAVFVGGIGGHPTPVATSVNHIVQTAAFYSKVTTPAAMATATVAKTLTLHIYGDQSERMKSAGITGVTPMYPRYVTVGASAAVAASFVGGVVGYLSPGPVTGAILPMALTVWWILYRVMVRYDQRKNHQ